VVGHIAVHQAAAAADRSAMTEVEVSRLFAAPTAAPGLALSPRD
jgi:hypothetical protein